MKADFSVKEKDLISRLEAVQHQRDMLQREHDVLREKINIQKQSLEQTQSENIRIRSDLEHAIIDRDRVKRDIAIKETQFNEQQLHDLKRDLEQTVTEWQGLEKEKSLKDKVIQQYKDDLRKEQEKSTLLKMQNDLLEERLKVANQELTVFRGINVYHSSMQAELQLYRKEKAAMNSSGSLSMHNAMSSTLNDLDISTSSSVADNVDKDMRLQQMNKLNNSNSSNLNSRSNHGDEVRRSNSSMTDLNRSDFMQSMEDGTVTNTSAQHLSMKDLMGSSDETVINRFSGSGRRSGEMEEKQDGLPDEEDEHYMFTLYNTKLDDFSTTDDHAIRNYRNINHNNNNYNYSTHTPAYSFDKPPKDPSSSKNSSTKAAVAAVLSDRDRQEILRQKNERKAARDQLLREKILKDNSYSYRTIVDPLAASSGGEASRNAHFITPTSAKSQDNVKSSSLLSKLRGKEPPHPIEAPPKLPTSPIVMARDLALRKPSKTDFERARRLLSM